MVFDIGEMMAQIRKGRQHQAKHFQPQDHAHAAHQEEASRGHANIHGIEKDSKNQTGRAVERAPKGSRKRQ